MKKLFLLPLLFLFGISCRAQETKVLICLGKSSYAYHSGYCQGLNKCGASVKKVTVAEAIKQNRKKACGYCYSNKGSHPKTSYSSDNQSSSIQCMAITQKGTRCSRKSKSGGYCWQHGG